MQCVNVEAGTARLAVQELADGIRFIDTACEEEIVVLMNREPHNTVMMLGNNRLALSDAQHFVKGDGIAQRDVYHYVTRNHATALRAGLTVHHSAFSSTPHAFERAPVAGFEEVFYFMMPANAKGILEGDGLWPNGEAVNEAWPIYDGVIAQVPMGWHRVIALPDADGQPPPLAYVWCYICTKPEWEKD